MHLSILQKIIIVGVDYSVVYRVDELIENKINPITGNQYDDSWIVLMLTDSEEYQFMCGSRNGCAYTIKVSRTKCDDWKMAVGDFISFNETNAKNIILVLTELEHKAVNVYYEGHRYNEPFFRKGEPLVLVHSTPMNSWKQINQDGMLKSWNKLKAERAVEEEYPIGIQLGDPVDFSDYIMFGGGVTGEIVVNSKQQGKIAMDVNTDYLTGARLYFDAKRMAQDGLLIRGGCHLKVKDTLPLEPYLIFAATWENIGLESQVSTPKIFSEKADEAFRRIYQMNE